MISTSGKAMNETEEQSETCSPDGFPPESLSRPSRIIFGSCNSQHYEQPFWKVIGDRNPTAFVWAGDSIYGDDRVGTYSDETTRDESTIWSKIPSILGKGMKKKTLHATPEYLQNLYQDQLHVPEYKQLIEEGVSIFGAIDDHDYGINNGDKTFFFRTESGIEFTKFLGLQPGLSAMATRASKGFGVYGVQVYDFSSGGRGRLLSDSEAGLDPDVVSDSVYRARQLEIRNSNSDDDEDNRRVAIFVLDIRSNRTPWAKIITERFRVNPHGDFLGDEQWKWFETAIGRSNAQVNIIVSGVQVHAPWFYDSNKIENWSGFPSAQQRLYQTILQPNVRAPIIVSGDIHMAQILRRDCRRQWTKGTVENDRNHNQRPLYEVTTSGMTHSWGSSNAISYCGRPNKSKLCTFYPFQLLLEMVMTYAHLVSPWTALLKGREDDRNRCLGNGNETPSARKEYPQRGQLQYSLERNIAEFEFDWTDDLVTLRMLGVEGQTLLRQDWSMNRLTSLQNNPKEGVCGNTKSSLEEPYQHEKPNPQAFFSSNTEEYVCVNYRGDINRVHFAFSVISTMGIFGLLGCYPFLILGGVLFKFAKSRKRGRPSSTIDNHP